LGEITAERLAELEARVAADPAAACFGALAEVHRRAGRLSEAERVLRDALLAVPTSLEARALLALVLTDQGRPSEAHGELARIAATLLTGQVSGPGIEARAAEPSALSDAELDDAFAEAETDAEQLIDPNRVAQEAILHADSGAGEGLREEGAEGPVAPGQAFVTETMARLLDRQGDARGAARIRAALAAETPPRREPRLLRAQRRTRTVAVLERWLANLRRDWA
jgi:hypothetical protein